MTNASFGGSLRAGYRSYTSNKEAAFYTTGIQCLSLGEYNPRRGTAVEVGVRLRKSIAPIPPGRVQLE